MHNNSSAIVTSIRQQGRRISRTRPQEEGKPTQRERRRKKEGISRIACPCAHGTHTPLHAAPFVRARAVGAWAVAASGAAGWFPAGRPEAAPNFPPSDARLRPRRPFLCFSSALLGAVFPPPRRWTDGRGKFIRAAKMVRFLAGC